MGVFDQVRVLAQDRPHGSAENQRERRCGFSRFPFVQVMVCKRVTLVRCTRWGAPAEPATIRNAEPTWRSKIAALVRSRVPVVCWCCRDLRLPASRAARAGHPFGLLASRTAGSSRYRPRPRMVKVRSPTEVFREQHQRSPRQGPWAGSRRVPVRKRLGHGTRWETDPGARK